ncbi:hypothetical protein [Acetitomaculum ruminis]|nr:hypothetical protein [Acetitomaculum ruminis]
MEIKELIKKRKELKEMPQIKEKAMEVIESLSEESLMEAITTLKHIQSSENKPRIELIPEEIDWINVL